MIQKCPHCKRDVVFSRQICPACGHASPEQARGEATYMGEAARRGAAPLYTEEMETRMNAVQRRGRLQTGLVIGMLLAPLVAWNAVELFWLRPRPLPVALLAGLAWLCRRLWQGRRATRLPLGVLAAASGLVGLALLAAGRAEGNPVWFLACLVFGMVYLWCGWILLRSRDLPEWLAYQRRRQADA